MKIRTFLTGFLAVLAGFIGAGSVSAQTTEQDDTAQTAPQHLSFQGVSIEGDITDFTSRMQPRYRMKKRVSGEYCIFEGPVFGYTTYLQASYSRKSHTVYKVMVTPKAINQEAWLDSLQTHYGEPVETDKGLLWTRPEGKILFYMPQGYDPVLIYLDEIGVNAFVEEKK